MLIFHKFKVRIVGRGKAGVTRSSAVPRPMILLSLNLTKIEFFFLAFKLLKECTITISMILILIFSDHLSIFKRQFSKLQIQCIPHFFVGALIRKKAFKNQENVLEDSKLYYYNWNCTLLSFEVQ